MELIIPAIEHKEAALDFRQEHLEHGEKLIHGGSGLENAADYESWLDRVQAAVTWEYSETLVPASVFWGIQDNHIVGIIQIRHMLNKFLSDTYGHIGYGVRPSERHKGYATKMLALALDKCRDMEIDRVLVSCDKKNTISAKTIIKNGGVYNRDIIDNEGDVVQQYWITL